MRYLTSVNASGPTIAPIVTGSSGSSTWRGSNGGRKASTCSCVGMSTLLVGVREDEAVHADHDRQRELLGELERLDVEVDRLLVRLRVELDPAGVALRHRVAVVVPDVDRRADRAVGDRHHDRQAEPGGVVERLGHVEEPLAGRGRVGARAGRRGADRRRQRRELRLDHQVLARRELAGPDEVGERLDDVGLRRDRVRGDHLGPAERDRRRDRLRAFDLPTHARLRDLVRTKAYAASAAATLPAPTSPANFSRIAAATDSSETTPLSAAKAPSSAAFGSGRPRCSRARSVAGTVSRRSGRKRCDELVQPELREAARRVDEEVAVRREPGEEVDLVQQRRILDDQGVRLGDRLAQPDLGVVDAAERDDRGAGALRAEARERLRVPALGERRDRQQLGGGDDALAAASVDAHLEHRRSSSPRTAPPPSGTSRSRVRVSRNMPAAEQCACGVVEEGKPAPDLSLARTRGTTLRSPPSGAARSYRPPRPSICLPRRTAL